MALRGRDQASAIVSLIGLARTGHIPDNALPKALLGLTRFRDTSIFGMEGVQMGKTRQPYSAEFRRTIVDLFTHKSVNSIADDASRAASGEPLVIQALNRPRKRVKSPLQWGHL